MNTHFMKQRTQAKTDESAAVNQSATINALQAGSPLPGWTRMQQPRHWKLGATLLALGSAAELVAGLDITQQPTDQVVAIGGEARFSVLASGVEPLSYRWTFNDLPLADATQSYLRITNAQPESAGNYAVVITDSSGNTTNSQPRSLTVDREWVLFNKANSGLPYNGVVDFEMDRQGNVWILTGRWNGSGGAGLAKFDGANWTVWKAGSSPLPSNDGTGMTQDSEGNLWIATESGLAKFDRTYKWEVLRRDQVWYPKFDRDGYLWVGSSSGVLVFDATTWTKYQQVNSGLPNNFVAYITADDEGRRWISTHGGLAIFDGASWVTYSQSNSGLPNNYAAVVAFDSTGTAWVSTYGGGLAKLDGEQWTVFTTSNSPIPNANLSDLLIGREDVKWVATEGGLARFQGANWTVYTRSNSRLPDNFIYCIALDRYENLWIGTRDNGVTVFREGGVILRPQMKPPTLEQGRLVLRWIGGKAKWQLQSRASLKTGFWEDHGAPTDQQTLSIDATESTRFFRVTDSQP
jgi:sugar lactone lactonase YvrE